MNLGLGLDTGGTYTDSVIVDLSDNRVLCKSKSMTTHHDLIIGILDSIDGLRRELLERVGVVAMSSTLATNAVVEGRGCRVGLVCSGMDYDMTLRPDAYVRVRGGHGIHGEQAEYLDTGRVEEFLLSVDGRVDGIAVSSFMSVRNPEHEIAVRNLARRLLGVPVVCGHELSSDLGFNERTTTCVMNARLIPLMDGLISSVRTALDDRGVEAPLMIARGNGTMMRDALARERPVETIMSGPAASLMGAMAMSGLEDAIVMDMGGTTTDIGILRNGRPSLDTDGMIVDGKRTRVNAARIYTSGIGGDSRIVVNPGEPVLTPRRAIPLCVAATRWPSVSRDLEELASAEVRPLKGRSPRPGRAVLDHEHFIALRMPREDCGLDGTNIRFVEAAMNAPVTLRDAVAVLGCDCSDVFLETLEEGGWIQRIGLTPTDILHCDGTYTEFDVEASRLGVAYVSSLAGMMPDAFVGACRSLIRRSLCLALMDALIREDSGPPALGRTGEDLLNRAVTGEHARDFSLSIRLDRPIVGMGAPAGAYIRWVGEALGTEVVIGEDYDVGNAVGAVCSSISESVRFDIRPVKPVEGSIYEAFSRFGRRTYVTMDEAIEDSERLARDYLDGLMAKNGADCVCFSVAADRRPFIDGTPLTLEDASLTVTATGKPKMFEP